jgi:hypothetical protein
VEVERDKKNKNEKKKEKKNGNFEQVTCSYEKKTLHALILTGPKR